jgi:hypothetical protein
MLPMDTTTRGDEFTAAHAPLLAVNEVMRWLSAKTVAQGSPYAALDLFEQRWPTAPYSTSIRLERKAAVLPGTTTDASWAKPLVGGPTVAPLLALTQQQALIGRVPFQKVPFAVPVPVQSSLGTYAWVSESSLKPVTKIDWTSTTLPPGKVAGIVVLSLELVRLSVAGSENVMRSALTNGLVRFLDQQLLDPTVAGVAGKNPPSLTNAVTPITPVGTTIAAKANEVLAALYAARPAAQAVLIATPAVAAALAGASLTVINNQPHYAGAPLYTSPAAGALVIAADASAVLVATGGLEVDVSTEGGAVMDDAPASPPTAATVYMNFWQHNLAGFRVEQTAWWAKGANSVQVVAS